MRRAVKARSCGLCAPGELQPQLWTSSHSVWRTAKATERAQDLNGGGEPCGLDKGFGIASFGLPWLRLWMEMPSPAGLHSDANNSLSQLTWHGRTLLATRG